MECIEWAQKENRIFLRQALEARLIALYFDTKEYNKALQLGLSFICSHDITHTHGIIWCLPVLCDILKVTHGSSVAMCLWADTLMYIHLHTIHTHTHPFNGPLSGTTRVSRYQKGKTNLDFTGARDSEWQWNPLGHMQLCTSLRTDNHASTSPLSFLQAGCPSCRPTNSVKALKA